jgi:uncharacterized membrane protein
MAGFLTSLPHAILAGVILSAILVLGVAGPGGLDGYLFGAVVFRWLHVLSGIMWVGLLFYFNFVQIPSMAKIPDEQKPAVGKIIAPAALWWFRWAAVATLVTGLVLAHLNGYLLDALALGLADGVERHSMIGIGMWLGTVMAFNVWFLIWPAQKRVLGLVPAGAEAKARAARSALAVSRLNTALVFPMLFAMVSAQNLF